jgi:hypothetical protein
MKTPEELKESMDACFVKGSCAECHYDVDWCVVKCLTDMCMDAKAYIEQLEEQIMCMKIQMHGDCGVCKHRGGFDIEGAIMSQRCYECMIKETRPNWEYEGLPEVESKCR